MDSVIDEISFSTLAFIKHLGGMVYNPYITYRRLIERGKMGELLCIAGVCMLYFALSSLVKIQSFHPLLLTQQFLLISLGAAMGYLLMISMLYGFGALQGGKGSWWKVAIAWGYSYIPTTLWFLITSLLYVFLPPPRTQAPLGILFSLLYLIFSTVLFFWKAELYYLTLRFGMRLDLKKIIVVTILLLPIMVGYSLGMYTMGVFRIPFI